MGYVPVKKTIALLRFILNDTSLGVLLLRFILNSSAGVPK